MDETVFKIAKSKRTTQGRLGKIFHVDRQDSSAQSELASRSGARATRSVANQQQRVATIEWVQQIWKNSRTFSNSNNTRRDHDMNAKKNETHMLEDICAEQNKQYECMIVLRI